ncbi:MAG: HAMP domain-containing histidine kinase [Rhodospirillaceae bacterium]|nr:HAMP domain-containing histidine kinase [Rhodospirillaceae bacterium]MCA8934128.1 HAMP domain-containing histidine kinase [Rhodospirillaceae bacterium]
MRDRWTYAGLLIFLCLLAGGGLAGSEILTTMREIESELEITPLEDHRMLAGVIQSVDFLSTSVDAMRVEPTMERTLETRINLDRTIALTDVYLGRMPDHAEQFGRRQASAQELLVQLQNAELAINDTASAQGARLMAVWSRLSDISSTLTDAYLLENTAAVESLEAQSIALRSLRGDLRWVLAVMAGAVAGTGVLLMMQVSTSRARERARALVFKQKAQLEVTLQELRTTQAQLVESEKLAALGGLVAGVAHEVNTPIGITLTAASSLSAESKALRSKAEGGQLRKSEVMGYIDMAVDSTDLMERNCHRAAHLIQSFKQVSVDQVSDERRTFELAPYLEEIVYSLAPTLRRTAVEVAIACPPGLEVDSYPGALSQLITNLVTNSLRHAYDEGDSGKIRIDVDQHKVGWFTINFADDGKGVPEANVPRLFEPFFTTRRGQGGSGLGLHIVHNLVVGRMGGSIRFVPTPGGGATFVIEVPIEAPSSAGEQGNKNNE